MLQSLRELVGDNHVLTDAADMTPFVNDWRGRYHGSAMCAVRPGTTEEVARVVRHCVDANVAMVPQGGNTSLCGGATPFANEVIISLTRLNRVRAIDVANHTITVEAGCTLQSVQDAAAAAGLLFPLSIAAEGTATIGGNLSTNAGGVQVLRYGNARDLALGVEVVLPDGRVWNGLRGLRKDNAGYDLKHLFIGAEGTLGLITCAVLKLYPRPKTQVTAWVVIESPAAAVALLSHLKRDFGERVTALELIGDTALNLVVQHIPGSRPPFANVSPWQLIVELSEFSGDDIQDPLQLSLARAGGVIDAAIAQSEAQRRAMWALRENISEAQRREGFSVKQDIAIPVSRVEDFIALADAALEKVFPGVRIVCFGHVGDGNLHYNQSKPQSASNDEFMRCSGEVNRIVYDITHSLGGSISAEHGVGVLKRDEITRYKSEIEIGLMQSIKKMLDPRGLMNPGKVI